jgi:hypothetical protein
MRGFLLACWAGRALGNNAVKNPDEITLSDRLPPKASRREAIVRNQSGLISAR